MVSVLFFFFFSRWGHGCADSRPPRSRDVLCFFFPLLASRGVALPAAISSALLSFFSFPPGCGSYGDTLLVVGPTGLFSSPHLGGCSPFFRPSWVRSAPFFFPQGGVGQRTDKGSTHQVPRFHVHTSFFLLRGLSRNDTSSFSDGRQRSLPSWVGPSGPSPPRVSPFLITAAIDGFFFSPLAGRTSR